MALVRNGSTEALISLLGQSASVTSGVRLAALGAIKNFVIAAPSRKAVIEQGLIDPIVRLAQVKYTYLPGDALVVTFVKQYDFSAKLQQICSYFFHKAKP